MRSAEQTGGEVDPALNSAGQLSGPDPWTSRDALGHRSSTSYPEVMWVSQRPAERKETKMRKIVTVTAGLVAAVGIASGSAGAAPPAQHPAQPAVGFTAHATDTQSIVTTDAGSMVVQNGIVKVKAANGTVVAGMPLTFRVDDFVFPIAADIAGRTATLTPKFDRAHATYKPVALPYENTAPWKTPYDREQAAWS